MATPTLRLFIAMPIPAVVRAEIAVAQDALRRGLSASGAKWTRPDQFHLTLRFLGDVEEARVPELMAALRSACDLTPSMELIAERLGVFPHLRFPRVAWAWVHDAADELIALQARIEKAVAPFSSKPSEKKFIGHVTLARLDGLKRPEAEALKGFLHAMEGRSFGAWTAEEVHLVRSDLAPTGAQHTLLAVIPLGRSRTSQSGGV